jgi:hypothetical protein
MGFIDELGKMLRPHSMALNQNIQQQGSLIHSILDSIEDAIRYAPTVEDRWERIRFYKELAAEEMVELREVPVDEIWLIQAIVADGVHAKSPPGVIQANGLLISSLIKEYAGTEKIGADVVALPGEIITLTAREKGTFSFVIHLIRKEYPQAKRKAATGSSYERVAGINTHDPQRDVIESRTGQYLELPGETRNAEGQPPLIQTP